MLKQYLPACQPVTTHGVRGELKVRLEVDDTAFLKQCRHLYRDAAGSGAIRVTGVRPMGQLALLTLEGVDSMDAARPYVGKTLYFDRNEVKLPKGAVFISDLLGCEVRDAADGRVYGTITAVNHPGAQDIYTVKNAQGKEYLFPAVPAFLAEKRVEEGYVTVTPIPGLLDEGQAVVREEE